MTQYTHGIQRPSRISYFKMKNGTSDVSCIPERSQDHASGNNVAATYRDSVQVCVHGNKAIVLTLNNQIPIALKFVASINDYTWRDCVNWFASDASNVNSVVAFSTVYSE